MNIIYSEILMLKGKASTLEFQCIIKKKWEEERELECNYKPWVLILP